MTTFNTDATSRGGTVYNINRDCNINFNLLPGCVPPKAMDQILQHIYPVSSTLSRSVAQPHRPSQPLSDQITNICVAGDPFDNSAIRSIDRVHVLISMVQTMMANPMVCPSKDLEETLASLKRLLMLMELALRAYRHTHLVHSLGSAISIGAEECRRLLDDLISNMTDSRQLLSNAVLYFIQKYMWARIGWQDSAISTLNSKLRKSHSSFAACLLALGRAAWPELKRGREQETLNELANFYAQLEQESTSLRHIKVDAVIVQDHLGRNLLVPMIFCTSSQDFHIMITGFCRNVAGDVLIQRGNYRILNSEDDQVINPEELAIVLQPGMTVGMSIVFHEQAQEGQGSAGYSCPRCKHINSKYIGWVTCAKCNGSFKISPEEESIVSPEIGQRAGTDSFSNEIFLFRRISIFQTEAMVLEDGVDLHKVMSCKEHGFPKTDPRPDDVEVLTAWRGITNTPGAQDSDIASLCSEFSSKAKCDGTRVVLDHYTYQSMLAKFAQARDSARQGQEPAPRGGSPPSHAESGALKRRLSLGLDDTEHKRTRIDTRVKP